MVTRDYTAHDYAPEITSDPTLINFVMSSKRTTLIYICIYIYCYDVVMSAMASQITSLTIVYSTVYSRSRSKKTSKLRVTGPSPVTGEFPAQRASNAENVAIWWRHHVSSLRFCGVHMKDTSQQTPTIWINKTCAQNILLNLQGNVLS